ncbi:MAG: adenosylhomocysteinase [Oscillospiraceae bacterium]|nr:adenosylhomocysteinase [Oscillospiraceae bacterium]
MMSDVRDLSLAPLGEKKMAWAYRHMPVLNSLEKTFEAEKPFKGLKITLSIHLEAKTACLCRVLEKGGAEMHVTGSNPLSTQDEVTAALAAGGMDVHAYHGAAPEEYERHLCAVLEAGPDIIIDDGGDLVHLIHMKYTNLIPKLLGGCEETTTGVQRLNIMAKAGALRFPMVAVNNAGCKYLFDNRYGTGQSVFDAINTTTNLIIAGKTVVIAGYGWCGKGTALRAKGLGARVIITEIDPIKAIEAVMDGFEVMPMAEAAKRGDIFVTVTGCEDVITREHFTVMQDGAILTNAGHFDVEVNLVQLAELAKSRREARKNIEGFVMEDGRTLYVIGEGRLVNLAAGDGHPAEIMDMSFAIQALSARYLVRNKGKLAADVISVPREVDEEVAAIKLRSLGITLDTLTEAQKAYIGL